jgi:hypothetical protein
MNNVSYELYDSFHKVNKKYIYNMNVELDIGQNDVWQDVWDHVCRDIYRAIQETINVYDLK